MAYLLEGIIAGVVVFFALMAILILFVEDIETRVFFGLIFMMIALSVAFFYFSASWNMLVVPAAITIAIIVALVMDRVVEAVGVIE